MRAVQPRLEPVVDPPLRQRERLLWVVVLESWLHEHRVDVRKRVPFEVVEEPRTPFPLHRPHADRRDRLLKELERRL